MKEEGRYFVENQECHEGHGDTTLIKPIKTIATPLAQETKGREEKAHFADEEYLVTAFVPSETACLASSPGRINRTL